MKNETPNKHLPAFACVNSDYIQEGLSKREYFAAMAMQGLVSNPEWMKEYKGEKYLMQYKIIAEVAAKSADALLAELDKRTAE